MSNEVTLAPCPFCGGEAVYASTRFGYPASHWVKCERCRGCTTEYSNRAAAAKAWNTRADTSELLREARDCIQSGAWAWQRERVLIDRIRAHLGEAQ